MKNKYFKKTRKVLGVVLFILTIISANAQTVLTVTKTSDPNPFDFPYNYVDSLCDPVMFGTLQWAIRKANDSPDTSTIVFNISGSGQHIILLSYELPSMSKPVNIDGTTQQGYQFGHPVIIIDGGGQIATGIKYYMINGQVVKGLQIQNFWMQGIHFWGSIGAEISNNVINRISNGPSDYAAMGIRFDDVQNTNIKGNYIGTDFNKVSGIGCEDYGIHITQFTLADGNNIIGGSGINDKNVIAFNGLSGIWIAQSLRNLITRNPIFNNSIGIHLVQSANNLKPSPIISTFTSNVLSGTSQPYDIIEIFGSTGDENANEYIASTTANTSGNWSINVTANYPYFIATATDINNNTSKLSSAFLSGLPITPLTVSYTVIDATCNGASNGSISIVASGGVPPYMYQWNNGQTTPNITGLTAGIYDVIVSDSLNNTVVQAITINEPPIDLLTSPPACSELFISEYVEGTVHKTALEFYNPSDDTLLLNRYFVRVFMNGAPTPLVSQLSGILLPGKTHVIANPNADAEVLAIANQTSNKINFNGDDAIQFVKVLNNVNINLDSIEGHGGNPHDILDTLQIVILDQIGITNVTPGNGSWYVGNSGSTKNSTIIRNVGVSTAQPDWNCAQYQWQSMPQNDISNLGQHQNVCKLSGSPLISLRFQNPSQTTISGKKYFNFDVEVKASSDSASYYFNSTQFFIKFNIHSFGTNANVTIQRGSLIADSITYNTFYVVNWQNNNGERELRTNIHVLNQNPSINRIKIPTIFTKLAHYSIEIDTCNYNSGLSLDSTYLDTNGNRRDIFGYVPSAAYPVNPGWGYYGPVYVNDMMNINLCDSNLVWISDFTKTVYPGTWYPSTPTNEWLMEIHGVGFDTVKGNVYFLNADDGVTYVPLNKRDYSWSDDLIKIRMPSVIDSFPSITNLIYPTPGSGVFYIKTSAGDSTSSAPLTVSMPYSIKNAITRSPYLKGRANLVKFNPTGGYIFQLDNSILQYQDTNIVTAIKQAFKNWRCATKVNFIVGRDTTLAKDTADGISVIFFVDSLKDGAIITTHSHIFYYSNSSDTAFISEDIDIAILRNPVHPWYIDVFGDHTLPADSNDFLATITHEIGHAALLGHVNENNDLMYYLSLLGPLISSQRLDITDSAKAGGISVVNRSSTSGIYAGPFQPLIPIVDTSKYYSCDPPNNSVTENKFNDFNICVYPNPINDNQFIIDYHIKEYSRISFIFVDMVGKTIFSSTEQHQVDKHQKIIKTGNIESGIYFLKVIINNIAHTYKLVKM